MFGPSGLVVGPGFTPPVIGKAQVPSVSPVGTVAMPTLAPVPTAPVQGVANTQAAEPTVMTNAHIFSMPDQAVPETVSKTFVMNGTAYVIHTSTRGSWDAEAYLMLRQLMRAQQEQALVIPTPTGVPFQVTDPVYIAELKVLTYCCPQMSLIAWATLGRKVGARGVRVGESGLQDVVEWVCQENGISRKPQAEDEQSAGEGARPDSSNTD